MKKFLLSSVLLPLFSAAFAQIPVIYYDFELNTNRATFENAVEQALSTGNSAFSRVSTTGGTLGTATGAGKATYNGGSASGMAMTSARWPTSATDPGISATEYFQCKVNTTGLSGLSLSLDVQKVTGQSPNKLGVLWSTDGVQFKTATTAPLSTAGSYTNLLFDMPAGADNQGTLFLRLYAFNSNSTIAGLDIDNVTMLANTITGVTSLFDFDAYGASITSGTAKTVRIAGNLNVSGPGTLVTLNSKLNLGGTITVGPSATLGFGAGGTLIGGGNIVLADGSTLQLSSTSTQSALKGNVGNSLLNLYPNATIEFVGTATQYQDAATFSNVIVNNAGGLVQTSDVTIKGNLTLKKGTMNPGQNKMVIRGNIVKALGAIDASNTEVELSGSANQTVDAASFTGAIKKLHINNPGDVTFNDNLTVSDSLKLTAGKLNIGSKKLTILGSIGRDSVTQSGSIEAAAGTVEFASSLAQDIPAGTFTNYAVKNIRVSNTHANGVSLKGRLDLAGLIDFGAVNNSKFNSNGNLVLKSSASNTAMIADLTNGGVNTGNDITGDVTVERYSPALSSRRYRLMTSPVKNTTINEAWQEGQKWDGSTSAPAAGYGTLITGQQPGTASKANNNGFDYWSAVANSAASVRMYVPGTATTAASWQAVTSTLAPNAFDNSQAYLLFIRGDRTVSAGTTAGAANLRAKGKLKNGTISIDVPVAQTYKLIGNPYASTLDFKKLYDANSTKIQPYFWSWQAGLGTGTGGYVLVRPVSPGSDLYEAIPGDGSRSAANRLIHSGEGFFVMPNPSAKGTNTIIIQESHKSTGTPGISVFRQMDAEPAKLYTNLSTGADGEMVLLDGVMAQFEPASTGTNVTKSANSTENLSIVKNNRDVIVASDALPNVNDTLKLRLWNTTAKNYAIQLRAANFGETKMSPVLIDRYLKSEMLLTTDGIATSYPFTINSDAGSKDPSRFLIVFRPTAVTLPLLITRLKATQDGGKIVLQWWVPDETGIKTYEVERSTDGQNYIAQTTITARAIAGEQVYTSIDQQPAIMNYYRVKMIGTEGETKYSPVVTVQLQTGVEKLLLFPNPVVNGTVTVQLVNKPKGTYSVVLYNMAGQTIVRKEFQHSGGSAAETISLPGGTPKGNYRLEVKDAGGNRERIGVSIL